MASFTPERSYAGEHTSLIEALDRLRGDIITELQLRAYGSLGYWSATLYTTSAQSVTIRAVRAPNSPFDTSTLQFSTGIEEPPSGEDFPSTSYAMVVSAGTIMLVERDEWLDSEGRKQSGPRDCAPASSTSTNVICGIVLQDLDAGHSLLFFLDEIPGVLGVYATRQEIAQYTNRFTTSFR